MRTLALLFAAGLAALPTRADDLGWATLAGDGTLLVTNAFGQGVVTLKSRAI